MDLKQYAIIELGDINCHNLGYFDNKPNIIPNSDIYKFGPRGEMTDEEYDEYIFTLKDLIQNYEYVLVCGKRSIIKFIDDFEHPIVVSSRSSLGDVRYGVKETVVINNPYYKKYVAQVNGENGPTVIAENGKNTIILPTFDDDN